MSRKLDKLLAFTVNLAFSRSAILLEQILELPHLELKKKGLFCITKHLTFTWISSCLSSLKSQHFDSRNGIYS